MSKPWSLSRRGWFVVVSAVAVAIAHAGPLSPPLGPVTGTGKTLAEVEPRIAVNATNTPGTASVQFIISSPGSYYLTGNIAGAVGSSGIQITASGVTLDLNGFEVAGVPGSSIGITVSGSLTGITVKNGTVRGWGGIGINLSSVAGSIIRDIIAVGNGGSGIFCGTAASVSGCVARLNGGNGIRVGDRGVVHQCTASNNTNDGITVGTASTVSNCSASSNEFSGIRAGFLCTISDSTASQNTLDGITVQASSAVIDCSASENQQHGILATFFCMIRGNTCANNTASGIRVLNQRNRIERNNCSSGGIGIEVRSTLNIVIGNTCGGNTTNYSIFAGNRYGPIVDATATNGAGMTGNSAASTLLSTDANANYAH